MTKVTLWLKRPSRNALRFMCLLLIHSDTSLQSNGRVLETDRALWIVFDILMILQIHFFDKFGYHHTINIFWAAAREPRLFSQFQIFWISLLSGRLYLRWLWTILYHCVCEKTSIVRYRSAHIKKQEMLLTCLCFSLCFKLFYPVLLKR